MINGVIIFDALMQAAVNPKGFKSSLIDLEIRGFHAKHGKRGDAESANKVNLKIIVRGYFLRGRGRRLQLTVQGIVP